MFNTEEKHHINYRNRFNRGVATIALAAIILAVTGAAFADEVTDWNQYTINAIQSANASSVATMRILAIEQAAVFDAVNGVERRFTHIYVRPDAPRGASSRAAAVQAAYAVLVRFFPSQKAGLDAQREASLDAIAGEGHDRIRDGVKWGQKVADEVLARRCGDGSDAIFPPFTGGTAPGQWRPTPTGNQAAQTPELAHLTPFAMNSPGQFRPAGPQALTSAQYAADFNETKSLGKNDSPTRTAEQTQIGLFWGDNNQIHWNRIALYVAAHRSDSLVDNARLFALLNLAASDANIVAWEAKYHYNHWRPITAIRLADTDGNDDTAADAAWTPLQTTPNHQEYVSGHSAISGAVAHVLAAIFGDNVSFEHGSDTLAGVTRTHTSFSAAADEANESRIFTGAHFRSSCDDGKAAGEALGAFVLASVARPHRDRDHNIAGQESKLAPADDLNSCPPHSHIHPPTLPDGTRGAAYSQQFFFGPNSEQNSWSVVAGSLPAGLTLNAGSGLLSGVTKIAGVYNFTVRAERVSLPSCFANGIYTLVVAKSPTSTTLSVSANPVTAGQSITLTARVTNPLGGAPTGTVKFKVGGSGIYAPLVGDVASLNTTAPGVKGDYALTALYTGDTNFSYSSDGLTLSVFDYSIQDDATGDRLFFNSDGTYRFVHIAGASSLILNGKGVILTSPTPCVVNLEHIAADRMVTAEAHTCEQTGSATVVYQGVTYTLTQGSASSASFRRR